MEINTWLIVAVVAVVVYLIPVFIIKIGLTRRRNKRRSKDRRERFEHVPIERRINKDDRRKLDRRG